MARGRPPSRDDLRGKSHEDLEGGRGREVFFRPQRYRAEDLGPIQPLAGLVVEGSLLHCNLVDISQNGVAFEWPLPDAPEIGRTIKLVVSFDRHEAYRGDARVGSVRAQGGRTIIGASLVESLMSIEDVLHLRDIKNWSGQEAHGLRLDGKAWRVDGHERFKGLVAELRLYLEDAADQLGQLEAALPWYLIHGEGESPARVALVDHIRAEFVPGFVRYSELIDDAVRAASEEEAHGLQEFSLRHVHELLMRAPVLHRARHKPLGYAGDYELMRYIYERQFEGPTLFAKALHLGVVSTRCGQAVRGRRDLIKERLRRLIRAGAPGRTLRIASVASGPAQELFELLGELEVDHLPGTIEVVLFEQDRLALSFAQARLNRLVENKWHGQVRLTYLYDSIKRLVTDPGLFHGLGPFDLIFCAGLVDYLRSLLARALCKNFYANLREGGTLYVGNMVPSNPTRWLMEHHSEWSLMYREHEEILALGEGAGAGAELSIEEEPTGLNPFLVIRKRDP